jgi:hypothetical protein
MFQLQRAIIRPTTERSPGTFSDCAHSLNVPVFRVVPWTVTKLLHYYNITGWLLLKKECFIF